MLQITQYTIIGFVCWTYFFFLVQFWYVGPNFFRTRFFLTFFYLLNLLNKSNWKFENCFHEVSILFFFLAVDLIVLNFFLCLLIVCPLSIFVCHCWKYFYFVQYTAVSCINVNSKWHNNWKVLGIVRRISLNLM